MTQVRCNRFENSFKTPNTQWSYNKEIFIIRQGNKETVEQLDQLDAQKVDIVFNAMKYFDSSSTYVNNPYPGPPDLLSRCKVHKIPGLLLLLLWTETMARQSTIANTSRGRKKNSDSTRMSPTPAHKTHSIFLRCMNSD